MKALKDIIKRVSFKPNGGLKGELYHLVKNQNYDSNEVKEHFKEIGKLGQLNAVNQHLKDSLLNSVLTMPLYTVDRSIKNRIRLLRKELQARILLYIGSKIGGTKVAIDTIVVAEKNQEFEVVHRLCKELINLYSISQPDTLKYRKYRTKMDEVEKFIQEELQAEKSYFEIRHYHNTNQSIVQFPNIITKLNQIKNTNFKFNFFRFSIKSFYYQLTNDHANLVANNKAAYTFFDLVQIETHYITKLNFISDLIPYYISANQFIQAESAVNTCLELPPKGSYNWHRILIYKAILGLYSNKPRMSLRAFKTAHALRKRFNNKTIVEYWHLILGYLVLLEKVGELDRSELSEKFKLGKYLNVEEEKRNDIQKANLIILELLHLLVDGEHSKYLEKLEKVESFIQSRFRAHPFKRTRHFLRLLKSVVKGNYHVPLVEAHGKRQLKNLAATRKDLTIETIDLEIVPYELLWGLVLVLLKRK